MAVSWFKDYFQRPKKKEGDDTVYPTTPGMAAEPAQAIPSGSTSNHGPGPAWPDALKRDPVHVDLSQALNDQGTEALWSAAPKGIIPPLPSVSAKRVQMFDGTTIKDLLERLGRISLEDLEHIPPPPSDKSVTNF